MKWIAIIVLFFSVLSFGEHISRLENQVANLHQRIDKLEKDQQLLWGEVAALDQQLHPPKIDGGSTSGTKGKASYYDYVLDSGWSSKGHLVCAARDWPRKTTLRVINTANGKETTCVVTDFGPAKAVHPDRIIDLSSHAFSQLSPLSRGVIEVAVEEIK